VVSCLLESPVCMVLQVSRTVIYISLRNAAHKDVGSVARTPTICDNEPQLTALPAKLVT